MKILITGGAGFIGSNLATALLNEKRITLIRVLDNFATGSAINIRDLQYSPSFEFIEGDIRNYDTCLNACAGIDLVSHQAALGSVPRSIKDPLTTNEVNVTGTLNIFNASKEKGVKRIVYAASSSTYGDHAGLPKIEDRIGKPLSPYAVTKYVNELYAGIYSTVYGMQLIGLRYFNIFGPRQSPDGPYAAVIPLFIDSILSGKAPVINGDGATSRDFTYIDNAVQANILALFAENNNAVNEIYNIACGEQTSLLQLFSYLTEITNSNLQPVHGPERKGDVQHSLADISKARELLSYKPSVSVRDGLKKTIEWYQQNLVHE